ncbi:hypothetical protein [Gemmata sp.]|uniref:hypothetical protein n=1 Tax=Gemmata sp. TaxID=1914242 RepID=UPI003F704CDB
MRVLQNVLLVIGAPALGVATCGLGLASVLAATAFRTRPGQDPSLDWGATGAFLCCGLGGGAFGAVAGLVLAVRWMTHHRSGPWGAATWVGVVLGVAVVAAVRLSGVLGGHVTGAVLRWGPGLACLLAAGGTLGGLLGGAIDARRGHREARRRRRRHTA